MAGTFGIKMTIVEPGGFRTDWAGASTSFASPMKSYEPVVGAFKEWIETYTGTEHKFKEPKSTPLTTVWIVGAEATLCGRATL